MKNIIQFFKERYYLLTPLLMFMSFPSFDLFLFKGFPFFAWIALIPIFLYVRDKGLKEVYYTVFITGFFGNLLTYNWVGNFGISVPGGFILLAIMLSIFLSVFFSLKIFLSEVLSRKFENLRFLIYPSVWLFVDWIQSLGFFAFPLPYWAYSQHPFTSFIQVASITGVMGITFILIIFNYLGSQLFYIKFKLDLSIKKLVTTIEGKRFVICVISIVIIIIGGTVSLIVNKPGNRRDMRVSLVQSCINPWENWSVNRFQYLRELKTITEDSMTHDPDFLIWSESATLDTLSYNFERSYGDAFLTQIMEYVNIWDKPLLTGEIGIVENWDGNYVNRSPQNNAVLFNNIGEVLQAYSKIHLVPLGEWFPYQHIFPFLEGLLRRFGASQFIPGEEPVLFNVNNRKFGVLICYEGIFHGLCRTYKNMGAEFFVNITNDGWTHTYSGHMQHYSVSIFRSIENGIWYVRAGNTGFTALIDPYGRVVSSIPIWEKTYMIGDMDFSLNHDTIYSKVGDLFLYLTMVFTGIILLLFLIAVLKERSLSKIEK